jgi:hypothetical protein
MLISWYIGDNEYFLESMHTTAGYDYLFIDDRANGGAQEN